MVSGSALANFFVEQSFQRKMAAADLVIVGTVVTMSVSHRHEADAAATVRPVATLKGAPQSEIVVRTQSGIPEADSDCCQVGATYVMFLQRVRNGLFVVPVNGKYGMIRIGPAHNEPEIQVIPPR